MVWYDGSEDVEHPVKVSSPLNKMFSCLFHCHCFFQTQITVSVRVLVKYPSKLSGDYLFARWVCNLLLLDYICLWHEVFPFSYTEKKFDRYERL